MSDEAKTEPALLVGSYRLIRRLGVGGMGEVWMAEREGLGGASKRLAIKLLRDEHLDDAKRRDMFLSEARLAMLLSNSNIVQVFDVGESEDGAVYMAMEWVEGLDLDQLNRRLWARGERLSPTLTAYVIGELLKALACAHDFVHEGERRAIIHRDVTPHNVMISIWGEIKLMDFGVARMASEQTSGLHAKGKLRYMPPEQLVGESRTATIDLFAVGAILHELLDGRGFRSAVIDDARLFGMVIRGEVEALREPEDAPAELDALRRALLEPAAERRLQSAREAHRALSAWPGYRDAKFELEDLVRRLCSSDEAASDEDEPTRAIRRGASSSETAPWGEASDEASLHSRTLSHGSGPRAPQTSTAELDPPLTAAPRPAAPRRVARLGVGSLAVLLLSLGGIAASQLVAPPIERLAPDADAPLRVADELRRVPWRAPAPPAPPSKASADKASELSSAGRRPLRRVNVTVRAPKFFYVEIRVGGQQIELDNLTRRRAKLRLRPGHHVVEYRQDATTDWRRAGELQLTRGQPVELTLSGDGINVVED